MYRQEGCIFSFTGLHIYQPWDLLWQHWFESLCCVLVLSWKREVRKVWRTAERGSSPTLERWLSSQSVACWRRSDSSWCCCWLGKNLLHQQHLSLLPGSQAVELPALVIQTAPAGFSRSWGQVRLCCLMCPHTVWYLVALAKKTRYAWLAGDQSRLSWQMQRWAALRKPWRWLPGNKAWCQRRMFLRDCCLCCLLCCFASKNVFSNVFSIHLSPKVKERTKNMVNVGQERHREVKRERQLASFVCCSCGCCKPGVEG